MTIKRKKKNMDEHISKYIRLFAYAGRSKAFYEEPMTRKTRIHARKYRIMMMHGSALEHPFGSWGM